MTEVTRILSAVEQGDPHAAEQLLPLIYEELRQLAAARLAQENPGQTLQPTALVHEAFLCLVGGREEVTAAGPVLGLLTRDQPEVGLVDQGSRLQGLPGVLLGQPGGGQLAQFLVDQPAALR